MDALFDETPYICARLSARADICGISRRHVELLVGLPRGAFPARTGALSMERERRLRRLDQVCEMAIELAGDDAHLLVCGTNRAFDLTSPLETMIAHESGLVQVRDWLRQRLDGSS